MLEAAADVDVAGVVPALGGVLEQVDGGDGEGVGDADDVGRQGGVGDEADLAEGSAGLNGTGAGLRIVDEVGALKVPTAGAEVADLDGGRGAELFFDVGGPLLDVLRGGVDLHRGEADGGLAEDGGSEVETGEGGLEVIALIGLGKDVGDVVALIAPGVHVDRGEEDAVGGMDDEAEGGDALCDAEAGCEVGVVGDHEALRHTVLPADEDGRDAILEDEVGVGVAAVEERAHVLVAEAVVEGGVGADAEGVLRVAVGVPLTEVHLGDAGLTLADGGRAEEEAGEGGAGAVAGSRTGGEAAGVLVVAAILEEAPHGPDKALVSSADFKVMTSAPKAEGVTAFDNGVPGVHGGGSVTVAERGVALDIEVRCAPCAGAAEAYTLDAKLRDDIVFVGALGGVVHAESGDGEGGLVDGVRVENVVPAADASLAEIVVKIAEAGLVLRHEAVFVTGGVAEEGGIAVREILIEAKRALVGEVEFVADVEVVIGVDAGTEDGRRTHHRRAGHAHTDVGTGRVFCEHNGGGGRDSFRGNDVAGEGIAEDLRVGGGDGERGVEGGIAASGGGIVDGDAAHREVAGGLVCGGHGHGHGVGFDVAESFVVGEEEGVPVGKRAAEGSAEVVLNEMFGAAHIVEGMGVECAIAEELVSGAVEGAGA